MILSVIALAVGATAAPLAPELEPLRFLVGYCWRSTTQSREDETHCYRTIYGGQHIRDRYRVRAKEGVREGERLFSVARDRNGTRIVFGEWSNDGEVRGMITSEPSGLIFGKEENDGQSVSYYLTRRMQQQGLDSYQEIIFAGDNPYLNPQTKYYRLPKGSRDVPKD